MARRSKRAYNLAERTIHRVRELEIGGTPQFLADSLIRGQIRAAIAHHLGLDIRTPLDGAA